MSGIFKAIFGGGGDSKPSAPKTAAAAGAGETAPGAVAPGTTPEEFRKQENAHYQQMLAGLGMGTPGGALPEGIQSNINKQADLIGK